MWPQLDREPSVPGIHTSVEQLQRPDTVEVSVPATGEEATGVYAPGVSAAEEPRVHVYSVWMHMLACV